jgi:hypothetical protein
MLVAEADFPFLEFLWSMMLFFAWIAWIWIAITCFVDIFRRHDIGGGHKALWVVFIIVIPFLGVLVYLIAQHDGLRERSIKQAQDQQAAMDQYVKDTAGGSANEIAKAKELLDSGAISQEEFDQLKAKALS